MIPAVASGCGELHAKTWSYIDCDREVKFSPSALLGFAQLLHRRVLQRPPLLSAPLVTAVAPGCGDLRANLGQSPTVIVT